MVNDCVMYWRWYLVYQTAGDVAKAIFEPDLDSEVHRGPLLEDYEWEFNGKWTLSAVPSLRILSY